MITSIDDLQKYAPINTHINYESIEAELKNAELFAQIYIEPSLIAQMKIAIAGSSPAAEWIELDDHFSKFIANWSIYLFAPKVYNSISNAGIRTSRTEDTERATKWSYEDMRKAYFDSAYLALEQTLSHIHKYCMTSGAGFPFYAFVSDDYRAKFKGVFSKSEEFNQSSFFKINFYTFLQLSHHFSDSVEMKLRGSFGSFLDTFIPKASKNAMENILFSYMRKIVANDCILRGLDFLILSYSADGIKALPLDNNDTIQGVGISEEQKVNLRNRLEANINEFTATMKQFIRTNHVDLAGIESTPIYAICTAEHSTERHNYRNAESKGSFFM